MVNPLRVCLAPLCLCLTAAPDDGSPIDADPPRLPSSAEVAQTSLSTQNDQNADYTPNFDVFINHRGKDVKDTLASHIYDLLQFHGVRAFLDREEIRTGEEFPHAITEAIQSSSVHIVIFSPHYAESDWCLRELALMLKTPNATIIPVFCNVTPGELRWTKGALAEGFDKHYRRYSRKLVDEWRAALQIVSNISGLSLSNLRGRLPTAVVQKVLERIKSEPLTVAKFPVGLEKPVPRLREYIRRCRMEKNHVAFVGIIGIAGIGKTTLIPDVSQGQIIRKRLSSIDALIVLDNIEDNKQLDAILSIEVLLPGSTVIVTSRDSNIFKRNNFLKYEMSGLNSLESNKLFCLHAFDNGVACAPFENLVEKFVYICKGVSLALEICGRELYCESNYAIWESYSKKISETILVELKSILQVTYDRLDEKQKQIFLDITIFFHGENVRTIERIWEEESENSFTYDIHILERKCMIKLERGVLTMHEAFCDLGRAIVDEESPTNPGGRSRLWRPNDIKKVLESFKGTESVRGLSLVFGGSVIWNRDRLGRPCAWPADAFANMKELKLLELKDDCVEGDLGKLPQELLWLRWRNYPYECMPPNLRINHARVLDFCGGKLVSLWDDQSQVPLKLQELNLQSLEVLKLDHCLNLEYLPSGFGGMRRLRYVSLRECQKLKALPDSFGLLPQIEYLNMNNCKNVKMEKGSFGSISTLKRVSVISFPTLETLPTQLTRQRSLQVLHVSTVDRDSVGLARFGRIGIQIKRNYGWVQTIREGEENLIQQKCSDFFRGFRRQRGLTVVRAFGCSLLDLRNVHALDIANCTIRRTFYLYETPIEEQKMELMLRRKQLFWRDDKELEYLDLSVMNSTSIALFLTLQSMASLYKLEAIISATSVKAYKDELQEYDYENNSVINSHANIPAVQVAKIRKSRHLLKSNKRGKDRRTRIDDSFRNTSIIQIIL
eukprot:Gb_04885 [translate_table: standard]